MCLVGTLVCLSAVTWCKSCAEDLCLQLKSQLPLFKVSHMVGHLKSEGFPQEYFQGQLGGSSWKDFFLMKKKNKIEGFYKAACKKKWHFKWSSEMLCYYNNKVVVYLQYGWLSQLHSVFWYLIFLKILESCEFIRNAYFKVIFLAFAIPVKKLETEIPKNIKYVMKLLVFYKDFKMTWTEV